MTHTSARIDALPLRGGHVVLDFVNTAGLHASDSPSEWLEDYAALAQWGAHTGLCSTAEAAALKARAIEWPHAAKRAHADAIALREALFRIFRATLQGRTGAQTDVKRVESAYADAAAHSALMQSDEGYVLGWRVENPPSLVTPYRRLARAAIDLLTSTELSRVHECEAIPCGWLFLDRSRNHSRRWCASEECGNKERVRRFRGG